VLEQNTQNVKSLETKHKMPIIWTKSAFSLLRRLCKKVFFSSDSASPKIYPLFFFSAASYVSLLLETIISVL